MKLIKPSFEILNQESNIEGVYKLIELAGRTCYKSEDKITETSAKEFVDRIIKLGHCYTGEAEVFTNEGWIKWRDYKGEPVAVINTDLTFKGYETPSRIISKSYTGNFYKYPELGIEVTDGHRMYGMFADKSEDRYSNLSPEFFECNSPYKDANGRNKTKGERFFRTANCPTKPINSEAYLELIGFWIGDGCHDNSVNSIKFHLRKKRKIQYLKELCNRAGSKYSFREGKGDYYYVDKVGIGKEFNTELYKDGNKYLIPSFDPLTIHSIILGLLNSDGSYEKTGVSYSSTSRQVIEWILKFAPIAGYSVVEGNTKISNLTNKKDVYKIFFLKRTYSLNNDSRREDTKVVITNKTEDVYCVTVSTGLLLIRGIYGKTTICGNCAMLEHGTIYLDITDNIVACKTKYNNNNYSKVYGNTLEDNWNYPHLYVTTNFKVLIQGYYKSWEEAMINNFDKNWLYDLQYLCDITKYHEKRVTVKFICDRGVSHEFVRHRVFSFAQESTRYCNYSKDKFDNCITYILPNWCTNVNTEDYERNPKLMYNAIGNLSDNEVNFLCGLYDIEVRYLNLLKNGWTPQQARSILPNSLKTELVMTGFVSDWEGFFKLRDSDKAHPQAKELAHPLHEEFIKKGYLKV